MLAGSAATTITVTGTGFTSSTAIQVAGVSDPTTFISSTQVTAILPPNQLAAAGTATIVASNGTSTGSISLQVNNPVPSVAQISPATLPAGTSSASVTLTGTGFVTISTVQVDGSNRQTTFISGTQISAILSAADLAAAGGHSITVANGTPGGGTSPTVALAVANPSPTITALSPGSILAGTTAPTTVTVMGTDFVSGSTVQVNGTARTSAFVSSTQLTFQLTASDQSIGTNLNVTITNPAPGGGRSTVSLLPVTNPVPTIAQFNPATLAAGSAATMVTVTGTNFVNSTVIQVAASPRPTTVVSSTQLTFQVSANDLSSTGNISFIAVNPLPGGGTSAAATISVNNPVPGSLALSPSVVVTGTPTPTTIVVTGTGFVPQSTVQVGGSPRVTSYVSSMRLTFQVTPADESVTANLVVTIVNPTPGGGASPAGILAVSSTTATPVITSVSPNQAFLNSPDTTISVFGSGLTVRSVVQWNGTNLTSTYGTCQVAFAYAYCLRASIPSSLLTSVATASLTVSSPTANTAVSNSLPFNVTNPPVPTVTSLSVSSGPTNKPVSLGVTGSGFATTSSVMLNGISVPTTFVSTTSLTAQVPASSLATSGVFPVTVVTPAPGGGTSAPQYFTAYVAIPNNSMVYNPVNGLFYLSVPSAAGAPYGNTVVSIDPLTGAIGNPIPVGSEPNRLAITSDGKYLWVALDGAAAVRKVDLTTGTAGMQFPIGPSGSSIYTVAALAALPGSPDSVVVSTYYGGYTVATGQSLSIYDGGIARPNSVAFATYASFPWVMLVDGTTQEIYGPGSVDYYGGPYITYQYDANGVSQKSSTNSMLLYAINNTDDAQIVGTTLYTDYGQGVNAETGALLGTFYSTGTVAAQGAIAVDLQLHKAFILEGSSAAFGISGAGTASATLAAFNTSDYSATSDSPIAVTIPIFRASYQYAGPTGARLTRWGSNGLAFRGTGGFVSLRSNLVKDLSAVNTDVAVSIAPPTSVTTGTSANFTATVTNNGPSAASSVSLVSPLPSSGTLLSVVPSAGSCSTDTTVVCNLGGLATGTSVSVAFAVLPTSAGTISLSTSVSASETDTVLSNNLASGSTTVTGGGYNLSPTLTSISPAGIATGSSDTQITLTGTGFSAGATVQFDGATLQTSFVSATQLTATVPSSSLASLGWGSVTVANPAPGGGSSASVPLYVFSVLAVTANDIVYDPYSRKLVAGLSTGTSTLPANSLVTITPETASIGTPVTLAGTATSLAITSNGQFVYALLPSATTASIARFSMLNQLVDFTASGFQATDYNTGLRDLATQPGSPNTLAVDEGEYPGTSLFDFDSTQRVATRRGTATGIYTGTCLTFPDPSRLFITDLYASGVFLKSYSVTAAGLINGSYPYYSGVNLTSMNCTKVDGNFLFGQAGGVASLSVAAPTQTGTFQGLPFLTNYGSGIKDFAPDAALGRSFYLTSNNSNVYSSIFDSITAFDIATYMPANVLPLPFATYETGGSGFTGVNMVRWGQDGLAVLSSSGNIYLVRGPVVVPGLLSTSTAATLISSSSTTLAHGSSNTLLTFTGTNFQPGVAVTWNGSYRSTKFVSSTQITVAVPSSDLTTAGRASLIATNPGAPGSTPLAITVQ